MWKFQTFSDTQILCEINFWDFRTKNAHFDIFEPLKLDFCDFLKIFRAEIYQKQNLEALEPQKLISRKT